MAVKKWWYLSHFIEGNHSHTYSNIRTKEELLQYLYFSTCYYIGKRPSDTLIKEMVVPTGGAVTLKDEDGIIHTWTAGMIRYNVPF